MLLFLKTKICFKTWKKLSVVKLFCNFGFISTLHFFKRHINRLHENSTKGLHLNYSSTRNIIHKIYIGSFLWKYVCQIFTYFIHISKVSRILFLISHRSVFHFLFLIKNLASSRRAEIGYTLPKALEQGHLDIGILR